MNILVCYIGDNYNPKFDRLKSKYEEVNFFFYKIDKNDYKLFDYVPSIQFYGLKKHLLLYPELKDKIIFFHDVDIIFLSKPNYDPLINDDKWYVGDTVSYIGSNYIKSKGEYIFDNMCDIVGIDKSIVEKNECNSGGAQYLIKNVSYEYLQKCENDSIKLFRYLEKVNQEDLNQKGIDIQQWCASMWSMLWNGWLFNHEIEVCHDLDFCMATSSISDLNRYKIYHNAGAIKERRKELFYKGDFREILPYNLNFNYISNELCSKRYVEEIQKAEKITCLL